MAVTQPCFVVEATYAPDAAVRRVPLREKHLERMEELADEGAVMLAGAYEDMSSSLLVFTVETEESVRAIIDSDVYMKEGVWTGYSIKVLNRVAFDG